MKGFILRHSLWVWCTVCTLSLSNPKLTVNYLRLRCCQKKEKNKLGFWCCFLQIEQNIFWFRFQFQDGFLRRLLHEKPTRLYALLHLHDKLTFAPCLLTFTGNPWTRQIIPLMAASGHRMHQVGQQRTYIANIKRACHRGSSILAVQQSICVSNEFSVFRRGFTLCLRISL